MEHLILETRRKDELREQAIAETKYQKQCDLKVKCFKCQVKRLILLPEMCRIYLDLHNLLSDLCNSFQRKGRVVLVCMLKFSVVDL